MSENLENLLEMSQLRSQEDMAWELYDSTHEACHMQTIMDCVERRRVLLQDVVDRRLNSALN